MSQYTLTAINNSTETGNFCIYQEMPDTNASNVLTLAWLTKAAHPTTTAVFEWGVDYNFVWSTQGDLSHGATFKTSQAWGADLNINNSVNFSYSNNAYTFSNLTQGGEEGSLYINQGGNVQPKGASVGVGMSGAGTFVVPSQPNMKLIFLPKPTYWIVFGNYTQGEVMDITELTNAQKVQFVGNVTDQTVTLNANNTWSLS